jgi:hypothetical protein
MIDEICAQHTITAVRSMIRDDRLPKDLRGVYELALGRIEQTGCQEYTAKMFSAIAAARRPISLLEMAEIVVIESCQPSWNPEDRIAVPEDMMSWVANLLILDEEDRTVSFTHHSVVNFLTVTNNSLFRLSLEEADHFLGKICVTYLNFRELQGHLVLRKEIHGRAQLQPVRVASTALSSAGGTQSWTKLLAKMVLRIRPDHRGKLNRSESTGAKSIETLKAELQQLQTVYYLLAYASEFWLDHSSGFNDYSKEFSTILILWKKLLTSPLPAAARPWDPEPWQEGIRSLEYAMESRNATLFAEILRFIYPLDILELTSGDAALLLKASAACKSESLMAWSSEKFWEGDWDNFFRSLSSDESQNYLHELPRNICNSLLELRKSLPSKPRLADFSRNAWLGDLFSAALLGALEHDYPSPDLDRLRRIFGGKTKNGLCSWRINFLSAAVAFDNVRIIESYCESYLSVDSGHLYQMEEAGQALVFAALGGSTDILKKLLKTQTIERRIPLEFLQAALIIYSCKNNTVGISTLFRIVCDSAAANITERKILITFGKLLERPSVLSTGLTALMAATIGDHAEAVALLMKYNAPVNLVDQQNKKALAYARSEAVRRLLEPLTSPPLITMTLAGGSGITRFESAHPEWRNLSAP